jgi:hypothetical protein
MFNVTSRYSLPGLAAACSHGHRSGAPPSVDMDPSRWPLGHAGHLSRADRHKRICREFAAAPSVETASTEVIDRRRDGDMSQVQDAAATERRREAADLYLVVGLEVAALLLWAAYDAADVPLRATVGDGVETLGVAAVVITTSLVTVAAIGLRWLLRNRDGGLRLWSRIAGALWVVSFLGPLGAPTSESMFALASFHLLVGGGIFFGVRRIHGR